jgi:hypothetical protein
MNYPETHHVLQTGVHHLPFVLQQLLTLTVPHHPGISEDLSYIHPLLEVLLQQSTDESLRILGASVPDGRVEVDGLLLYLLDYLGMFLACKGSVSRQ